MDITWQQKEKIHGNPASLSKSIAKRFRGRGREGVGGGYLLLTHPVDACYVVSPSYRYKQAYST